MNDDDVAVAATGLTKRFGDVLAVDDVTLAIPRGAMFGLLGPDGAGKSTTIRILATVLAATSGDAEVFGHSVMHEATLVTPLVGYMPQKFSMYPDLTVAENVDFFATIRGVPKAVRRQRSAQLLERMGLGPFASRRAGNLSGGMKQKLMLASVLIHSPGLLLLDEPTTGVDPVSRREFWDILGELREAGTTVLVATPYMDEAERCTQLAFLHNGRVQHAGTPAQIKALVPGTLVEVLAPDPRAALRVLDGVPGVLSAHVFGDVVRVLCTPDLTSATALRDRLAQAGIQASATPATIDMETAFAAIADAPDEPAPDDSADTPHDESTPDDDDATALAHSPARRGGRP